MRAVRVGLTGRGTGWGFHGGENNRDSLRRLLQYLRGSWRCWIELNVRAVERVPGKVSGAWVFKTTRVPVRTLFEKLEDGG